MKPRAFIIGNERKFVRADGPVCEREILHVATGERMYLLYATIGHSRARTLKRRYGVPLLDWYRRDATTGARISGISAPDVFDGEVLHFSRANVRRVLAALDPQTAPGGVVEHGQ